CIGEKFDFTHERLRQAALNRTLSPQRNLLQRDLEKALKLLAAELVPSKVEEFTIRSDERV
ncbi:MAG TPA: hypothetical protein VFD48_00025, partial [Pyrinomonadaceae bacterium]|nr:hypothetical protein [Pyrinomonadaceae bacterium]